MLFLFICPSPRQQAKLETPDLSVVKSVQKISWAAGCGALHLIHATNEEVHKCYEKVGVQKAGKIAKLPKNM